jgi:hypothetical protein
MNGPVTLIGVYRVGNAAYVRPLVESAASLGWTVAWWSLDEVVDDLGHVTVGSGPGARLPLLNEVLRRIGSVEGWLVVSDDDVVFDRGDLGTLVSLCMRARFDLAQPARSDSPLHHAITAVQRVSVARRTSFVEIGPLFVVGPRWRDRIVPFPDERGLGWGLELDWLDLHREGCMLGIVDAVHVRHRGIPGQDYDFAGQVESVHAELADRGIASWADVQSTHETWRPWQRAPRWAPRDPP